MTDERGLVVRGMSLARGGRAVLAGVDLDVKPGEIVALIGPNGAGKTTLLECMIGVRRADAGRVQHRGTDLSRWRDRCAVFAYMPDEADPPAELSVREVIECASSAEGASRSVADDLIRGLQLGPLMSASAGALSRGERRRVALFQALCTAKPVVVLDEPFGAFDPRQLLDVLAVVRSRAAAGLSIVASIHQMTDAEKIADRLVLLADGLVVAFGSLAELKQRAAERVGETTEPLTLERVFLALLADPDGGRDATAAP